MIDQKMIPDEAVAAAARAIGEETYVGNKQTLRDAGRAAIAAALNAWPNAKTLRDDGRRQTYIVPALILPLTTEASDE